VEEQLGSLLYLVALQISPSLLIEVVGSGVGLTVGSGVVLMHCLVLPQVFDLTPLKTHLVPVGHTVYKRFVAHASLE
jgi:hypothetical protein